MISLQFQLTSLSFPAKIIHMKRLLNRYKTHTEHCYLILGFMLSCFFMVPFLLLGTGSIVTYHDQLDGELLNYLLAAKYLFTDIRIYPEIMNGLPVAGAVTPAPLFILLYVFFKPFTAFVLSQWIVYLSAFAGMYLLLLKLTDRKFISFGIAVIFMLMPFYPVYGLCIPGQPMLFYAVLSLCWENDSISSSYDFRRISPGRCTVLYYLMIIFYGAASSPVLVGFACLFVMGLFALLKSIAALRQKKAFPFSPWFSLSILLFTYIVCNLNLIEQILFPESTYTSHKTELVIYPVEPLSHLKEVLGSGISYAQSYHTVLFFLLGLYLLLFLLQYTSKKRKNETASSAEMFPASKHLSSRTAWTLLSILMISLFSVFYRGNFVTELRNSLGGTLKTFNLDRICWLLPTAWCILSAYLLAHISNILKSFRQHALRHGVILLTFGVWGITVLFHSAVRPNLAKLVKGEDYYALDWNNFFAEDIFSQIEEVIEKPKTDYRVVSIGMYPAAAAYNGFYCLDGYSNNYPLPYKHTFRRIIEGELKKSDYIRTLFDSWGNRCYITTAEQANYYTFEKKWGSVIYDLDLNTNLLKELNCQYVFSAAFLMNAEEKGLSLLRETPFETENSWYHIYVYKVI